MSQSTKIEDAMREVSVDESVFDGNPSKQLTKLRLKYPNNSIRTTKYTIFTYLPKAIIAQFNRIANFYFVLIAIMQVMPYMSPLDGTTAVGPLIVVLGFSVIREGYEDYCRYKMDKELNNTPCLYFKNNEWTETRWCNLLVGDIVKLKNREVIPADMVILRTSIENNLCYIETASLDGEKSQKNKMGINELVSKVNALKSLEDLRLKINCAKPNMDIHSFEGIVFYGDKAYPTSIKQLLQRGAVLRNTEWAEGIVVYSGHQTKIMKNTEQAKFKQSNLEKKLNKEILLVLLFQMLQYLTMLVCNCVWNYNYYDQYAPYYFELKFSNQLWFEGIINMCAYFQLFNTMLPISQIVTQEFVKICQCQHIHWDEEMYDEEKGKGCKIMSTTVHEELGQIEYIFTDKTGTLTANIMELKYLVIGNRAYFGVKEPDFEVFNPNYVSNTEFFDSDLYNVFHCENEPKFDTIVIKSEDGQENYKIETSRQLHDDMFMLISTCHDCSIDISSEKDAVLCYEGASPDEVTQVAGARQLGYVFLGSTSNSSILEILGEKKEIKVISLFEFDNVRKRMSVLLQHNGVYKLYVKGADNMVQENLDPNMNQPFEKECRAKLMEYSLVGFRTLCMAMKVFSEKECREIEAYIIEISNNLNRNKLMFEFVEKLENNLFLLGVSAVEDRLQDNVPTVLANFIKAKIKVWVLTGDKLETAENIAKSCNLITRRTGIIRLDGELDPITYIEKFEDSFRNLQNEYEVVSVIVDGSFLRGLLADVDISIRYQNNFKECATVVCCRVTPKQKAHVVRLVRKNYNVITLAIGDGGNDVNMIQAGNIGIGIMGQEGMRAANASDFAITEFQSQAVQLFKHGRMYYFRNCEMIVYFFYKNMLFTIPQFFFAFLAAFSGKTCFDDWYMSLYNAVFTALPLMFKAVLDIDIRYKTIEKKPNGTEKLVIDQKIKKLQPHMYEIGYKAKLFNDWVFLQWIMKGIVHSFIIWSFTTYALYQSPILAEEGYVTDFWFGSITMFTTILYVANIQQALQIKTWNWFFVFAIVCTSILAFQLYQIFSNYMISFEISYNLRMIYTSPIFYLLFGLNVGTIIVLEVGYASLSSEFYLYITDLARILQVIGELKRMCWINIENVFINKTRDAHKKVKSIDRH